MRAALCREFAEAMRGLDAVITLSSLWLPCQIDDPAAVAKTYDQQCRLVFNVTGSPAISVPTGRSKDGVPLAMQIAARAFDEPVVFRIAQAYCEAARPASARMRRRSRRCPKPRARPPNSYCVVASPSRLINSPLNL